MIERMLIVEDGEVLRKHLARLLAREGYLVTTAGSRAEALGELAQVRFATLLLDIKLPDGDGLDLLAALDDERRPRHTVVMTAFSTVENETRAQQLGVSQVLPKPLDLKRLITAVHGKNRRSAA